MPASRAQAGRPKGAAAAGRCPGQREGDRKPGAHRAPQGGAGRAASPAAVLQSPVLKPGLMCTWDSRIFWASTRQAGGLW